MRAYILLVATLLALACVASASWSNCGSGSDDITIPSDGVIYTPDPPVRGANFTVALQGTANTAIASGKIELSVKYLGVPLYSHTFDMCSDFGTIIKCPIPAGPFSRTLTVKFPGAIPTGRYTGQIKGQDQNSKEIFCIDFDVSPKSMEGETLFDDDMVLNDEQIAAHNAGGHSWKAGRNPRFEGVTVGEVRRLLGTKRTPMSEETAPRVSLHMANGAPASFDWRQEKPSCVHPIRNQEQCGSCWAFGATEALSDRFCIQKGVNVILSPQELVSCDTNNYGCQGGYLNLAWGYMASHGVVPDSCYQYTSGGGSTGVCKEPAPSADCRHYHATNVHMANDIQTIYTMIQTGGPVEAAFNVYQDFMSYTGGVYKHVSGQLLGGHAVKIVGWGTEGSEPYWIVANSWGTSWGQEGFFLIARGGNECGIESSVYAGDAGAITN